MSPRLPYAVALFSLAFFLTLAIGNIVTTSPTFDETVHLSAGWSYLKAHDFRINPEHPPLLKVFAALPLLTMRVSSTAIGGVAWRYSIEHLDGEWAFAREFLYGESGGRYLNDPAAMFLRARIAVLLLCGVGTLLVIFFWAHELWGAWAAALAAAFFCFDPNFIAHSALVTTDVAVTFLMAATVYFFWRWCRNASALNATLFVAAFALAQVTKFSALLLCVIVPLLAVIACRKMRVVALAGVTIAATLLVLWGGYGFRFAAADSPLPMKAAVDEWYAKKQVSDRGERLTEESAARARATANTGAFGHLLERAYDHHLLPEAYLYGLAQLESHSYLRRSFLRGVQSTRGFPSYFFQAFLFKTPIPTIVAIACALFISFRTRRAEVFLLVPAAMYLLAAITSHVDLGIRHLLPVYPFLYVLCGILGARFFVAAAAAALSCLVVFAPFDPMWGRHLSYFNELAGGPRNGWKILSDSNIDWGQDLPRLQKWLAAHGAAGRKINLAYFGTADPEFYGISYADLVHGDPVVRPGYLAVSVSRYSGAASEVDRTQEWQELVRSLGGVEAGRAGYSILIFEIK